jgi:epoxyqueuosine reductase QueG
MSIQRSDLVRAAGEYVLNDEGNKIDDSRFYDAPFIGIASPWDPIFTSYKEIIGQDHLTPKEAFEREFGKDSFSNGSVISIVLPLSETVRKSNRGRTSPSREWALGRAYSDIINPGLAHYLEKYLEDAGYRAVAPSASGWTKIFTTPTGPNSIWSERHVAYVAGLGTFGLNDGLITDKGMTVRFISIITDLILEPDTRTAETYYSGCLFRSSGKCGACIKRCPVGAITENGHDRIKCRAFVYGEESRRLAVSLGGSEKTATGCGLCQTGVPCEFRDPSKAKE